jgi:hypothetical protein
MENNTNQEVRHFELHLDALEKYGHLTNKEFFDLVASGELLPEEAEEI